MSLYAHIEFKRGCVMIIDWMVIGSVATAFASIATAVGVGFCGIQLRMSKKHNVSVFEDKLDEQYRTIAMALPVDILIGNPTTEDNRNEVRELIFNYLDLSNEEVYLRAKGRISDLTWHSWRLGIHAHMTKPAFIDVFEEVKSASGFSYLERIVEEDFRIDPKSWF